MGCQFPNRDMGSRRPLSTRSTQLLAAFRPRRFSRPRRFTPPRALRACFIPQPRTGFSLQGFNGDAEPYRVLPGRCPLAVSTNAPAARKLRQRDGARLQGLAPCVACDGLRWTVRSIRTPRPSWDFTSTRTSGSHTVRALSRSFRPWPWFRGAPRHRPSACCQCIHLVDLGNRDQPPCSRFLA